MQIVLILVTLYKTEHKNVLKEQVRSNDLKCNESLTPEWLWLEDDVVDNDELLETRLGDTTLIKPSVMMSS